MQIAKGSVELVSTFLGLAVQCEAFEKNLMILVLFYIRGHGLILIFFSYFQGTGVVHLTGYNIQEDQGGPMMFESDDSSEEETETEEIPALTNGKKRKATGKSNFQFNISSLDG